MIYKDNMSNNFNRNYFKKRIIELGFKTEKDFLEKTLTPKTTLTHIKEGKCDLSSALRLCSILNCELNDLFPSNISIKNNLFKTISIVASVTNIGISSFAFNLTLLLSKRKFKTMIIEYGSTSSIDILNNLNLNYFEEKSDRYLNNNYSIYKHDNYLYSCIIENANNYTNLENIEIDLNSLTTKIDSLTESEKIIFFNQIKNGDKTKLKDILENVRKDQILNALSLMKSNDLKAFLENLSKMYNIEYFILNCRGITPPNTLLDDKIHFSRSENFINISDIVVVGYCTYKTNIINLFKLIQWISQQNKKVFILEFMRLRNSFFKFDKNSFIEYKNNRMKFKETLISKYSNNLNSINLLPLSIDYIEDYTRYYEKKYNIYKVLAVNEKAKIQKYKAVIRNIFEEIEPFLRDL